ncbi:hypothetical protein [Sphingomonas ginsenosidimutans]|jgi:hypothetical protein|uniref:hypothetical protein n=1 Tax=Sphingomonas ginsenosidimutans TaxID=862134 RepID=UPI001FE99F0A|nr:hypothetical protein [Sphingomonas ginsenosidimutans]
MDLAGYRPTLSEVAGLFGKSSRWISDLRAKGELPGDGATLAEFVAAWTSITAAPAGKLKPIDAAKARREAAKAEREEILTAQLKNELLPRTLVTAAVQSAFARVRSRLLSIASKVAPRVVAMASAVEIEETITELVHEALAELAATQIGVEEAGAGGGDGAAPGGEPADCGGGGELVAGADAPAAAAAEPVGGSEEVPQRRGKRRTG